MAGEPTRDPATGPLALAALTHTLTPPGINSTVYEPKWDGYRTLYDAGRLWSRRGSVLTRLFPDLAPVLAARLPEDVVLDGELVAWGTDAGRLDFVGLQARLTAGRRVSTVVARPPAQLVAFDVLAADGGDVRPLPLAERRVILEQLLRGPGSPIVLCQQRDELAVATDWLHTLTAAGLEGVLVKDASKPCPTREGQRVWRGQGPRHDRHAGHRRRRRPGRLHRVGAGRPGARRAMPCPPRVRPHGCRAPGPGASPR